MYCPAVFKTLTIYLSFVFKGIWTGIFFGSPSSEWDPSTTGANWGQSGVSLHGVVMFVMSVLVRISVVSGMKQLRTGYTIFSEHEEIVKCVFRRMSIPGVYDNLFCLKTCKCKHWLSTFLPGGRPRFGCTLSGKIIFWPQGIWSSCIFSQRLPESESIFPVHVFTLPGKMFHYCFANVFYPFSLEMKCGRTSILFHSPSQGKRRRMTRQLTALVRETF